MNQISRLDSTEILKPTETVRIYSVVNNEVKLYYIYNFIYSDYSVMMGKHWSTIIFGCVSLNSKFS